MRSMPNKLVELFERSLIEKKLHTLASRKLALAMLPVPTLFAAAFFGPLMTLPKLGEPAAAGLRVLLLLMRR